MKYLVFSFDDARLDTYTRAIPIMDKYSIKGVINVITDFVNKPQQYEGVIKPAKSMTKEMVLKAQNVGHEIACHGNTHGNTIEDIIDNINELENWGVDTRVIGFASPFSHMTSDKVSCIAPLLDNGKIQYVRSGDQVKREGVRYLFLYIIQRLTGSKRAFFEINKRHTFAKNKYIKYVRGITITKNTTVDQLKYFINNMPDENVAVLIFHSIFNRSEIHYNQDKWCWDLDKFEKFCRYIHKSSDLRIITHREALGEK